MCQSSNENRRNPKGNWNVGFNSINIWRILKMLQKLALIGSEIKINVNKKSYLEDL